MLKFYFFRIQYTRIPLVHSTTVSSLHRVTLDRMKSYTRVRLTWPYSLFRPDFSPLANKDGMFVGIRKNVYFVLLYFVFRRIHYAALRKWKNDWFMEGSTEGTTSKLNCPIWSIVFLFLSTFQLKMYPINIKST